MKRLTFWFLCGIAILGLGYFGTYAYYRFINPDGVIDCFSFRNGGSFSNVTINESTCGESIVSRLSGWTGKSIAPAVNQFFAPLAALDRAITGRSIRFDDAPGRPVFRRTGAADPSI